MLSHDLTELLESSLIEGNRAPDGMLHPSSIIAPLRHVMLEMAGAPQKPDTIASLIRLQTGTMWHSYLGHMLERKGVPVMREVKADPGLPEGWAGTADFLVWDKRYNGFVLVDLKTTKSKGLPYIVRDGAKPEHIWQVSAYWHAFVNMGLPMVDQFAIYYLPMDEDYSVEGGVQPVLAEVTPIPSWDIDVHMAGVKSDVDTYLASTYESAHIGGPRIYLPDHSDLSVFLTDELAAPQEREQKLFKKGDVYEVVLVPHWTSMFCPFDDALCDCAGKEGEPKTTKIGTWQLSSFGWEYIPRGNYDDIRPVVKPTGRIAA